VKGLPLGCGVFLRWMTVGMDGLSTAVRASRHNRLPPSAPPSSPAASSFKVGQKLAIGRSASKHRWTSTLPKPLKQNHPNSNYLETCDVGWSAPRDGENCSVFHQRRLFCNQIAVGLSPPQVERGRSIKHSIITHSKENTPGFLTKTRPLATKVAHSHCLEVLLQQ
jgi:hypothetical protein